MGDAAIGMTGMDIETAARNKIAILTVVFNNGVMGAEREELKISDQKYRRDDGERQLHQGGRRASTSPRAGSRSPPTSCGAIKEAVGVTEKGEPFLLEFVVKEGHDFSRYDLAGL